MAKIKIVCGSCKLKVYHHGVDTDTVPSEQGPDQQTSLSQSRGEATRTLRDYVQHKPMCASGVGGYGWACNCGLDDLLASPEGRETPSLLHESIDRLAATRVSGTDRDGCYNGELALLVDAVDWVLSCHGAASEAEARPEGHAPETPDTKLPTCACGEYYGSHAPDCPVIAAYDTLAAELARVRAELSVWRSWVMSLTEALASATAPTGEQDA